MGLLLSCDKCVGSGTETVITFSDKLVKRVADGNAIRHKYDLKRYFSSM